MVNENKKALENRLSQLRKDYDNVGKQITKICKRIEKMNGEETKVKKDKIKYYLEYQHSNGVWYKEANKFWLATSFYPSGYMQVIQFDWITD